MPLILFTIIFLALMPKGFGQDKPVTIKALSYNIHYGVGIDSKKDLQRIADVINRLDPDIVGLQEVADSMMTAKLSHLTNMIGVFGASTEKETPNLYHLLGITVPESQLFYGDAILSKHPIKYIGNLSIPSASSSRYEAICVDVNLSHIYGEGTTIRFVPTKQIDYVLVRPKEQWRIIDVRVIEESAASDHLPVLMTLEVLSGK